MHTYNPSQICTQFIPYWYTISGTTTASSNSPVCTGNTLNFTGTSNMGSCFYNWSGPNSFSSTSQNPSIPNVTSAAAGTYTLVISDGKACYGSATTNVSLNISSVPATSINVTINP